jgi:hypothetical protein
MPEHEPPAEPPPADIRKTERRGGPWEGAGDGAAYKGGYGAGGLSSGADDGGDAERRSWDAPGVTPDGRRTGSSMDGPRMASAEEGRPDPDLPPDTSDADD